MKKVVRWSIVGLGLQAERLAKVLQIHPSARLRGVYSRDLKHAQVFAANFGAEIVFDSYTSLVTDSETDAVLVCSPNDEHFSQVVSAVKNAKPVLCEKPFTLSLAEARAINRLAVRRGVPVAIGFHVRFHPLLQAVRQQISAGAVGAVQLIKMEWSVGTFGQTTLPPLNPFMQWRENPARSGGGALMARGVHLFDLVRFISGQEIRRITAVSDARRSAHQVDQRAAGFFELDSGAWAEHATSRIMPQACNDLAVYGTEGCLISRGFFNLEDTAVLTLITKKRRTARTFNKTDLYAEEIASFSALLRGQETELATLVDGRVSVQITDGFVRSAASGRTVSLRRLG